METWATMDEDPELEAFRRMCAGETGPTMFDELMDEWPNNWNSP